ncbi:hypothetical protein CKM354_000550300 [Cercospora kikuchii]|uniref:C3H1-type domain-containing protein n=1 Tax=Cercospora kikuchii TaxID=84275 RepID=A0A9P3FFM2_9PEZI|nr:uncharacterized protein CKM354_000550300 [Cercospora kikuchii]GIZ42227.1 hypothetical protein CKM354_000550300 [Cercospora kikuchii]
MTAQTYTTMPGLLPAPGYQQRSVPNDQAQPRLAYFIARPNGFAIPLIPADELPFTIKLQNVPRVLNPQDTYGMQYVGTIPYAGTTFKLDGLGTTDFQRSSSPPTSVPFHARGHSATGVKQYLAPDTLARQAFANTPQAAISGLDSNTSRPPSAHETAKSWRRNDPAESTDPTQSVIDAILRSKAGAETAERVGYRSRDTTPPPSGIVPDQDKKVFCTHWIMTGDCKFVQQGCRYKHEMPSEAKLKELGIRHTPRWWLEHNAAIRLGGSRNVAGPSLKPLEMLRKGEDADTESSSDESDESDSEVEVSTTGKKALLSSKGMNDNTIARKPIVKPQTEVKSSVVPPTRPSSPVTEKPKDTRKPSTTSDLIDFAPLLPSTAATTALPTAIMSRPKRDYNLRGGQTTTPTTTSIAIAHLPQTPPTTAKKTTKVFVPAGESPEHHIADMKKRERSTRIKQQPSRTPSPTHPRPIIPNTTKTLITKSGPVGLQASKHAPPPPPGSISSDSNKSSPSPAKRNKAGSRIRRPATSSATATSPASSSPPVAAAVNAGAGAEKKDK